MSFINSALAADIMELDQLQAVAIGTADGLLRATVSDLETGSVLLHDTVQLDGAPSSIQLFHLSGLKGLLL